MVGERIRYYRKRQKMTLRELGEKSGFENRGDVRIAQYENGSRVPKTGTLNRIAKALGIPPEELFCENCRKCMFLKNYYRKAQYSLDCENGIENAVLLKPQTPEMLLEEKQFQEQVYAAVMKLPEKQAKRIYARYYLGMTVNEIAEVEGVDSSRVRDSIRRGLKQLGKYF